MANKQKSIEEKFPDVYHDLRLKRELFERKYQIDANSGCWNWTGGLHRQGYGMMGAYRIQDQREIMITAHRASWRIFHGPITTPNIIHTCNNPACVNPDHLIGGTHQETMTKMLPDGRRLTEARRPRRRGIKPATYHKRKNWKYKWTDDEIQFIRTASLDAVIKKLGCTRIQAYNYISYCRSHYPWLPWPKI